MHSAALDAIRLPIIVLDAEGAVRVANAAANRLFRPEDCRQALVGQPIESMARGHSGSLFGDLKTAAGGGKVVFVPHAGSAAPKRLACEVAVVPPQSGKAPWLLLTTLPDVPNIRGFSRLTEQVRRTNADAAAAYREKQTLLQDYRSLESFSYTAAHDLQTPLVRIHMLLDMLQHEFSDRLPADANVLLTKAIDSARKMQLLISSLLDNAVSKSRPLELETLQLGRMIAAVKEAQSESLQNVGGTLTAEAVVGEVEGDPVLTTQLLDNLIANAIKYRHVSRPLRIRISTTETHGVPASLSISDNGIGFPEEHRESIFRPFTRINADATEGSGIGLSTCRNICDRHGWTISAHGVEGEGARFCITFKSPDKDPSGV